MRSDDFLDLVCEDDGLDDEAACLLIRAVAGTEDVGTWKAVEILVLDHAAEVIGRAVAASRRILGRVRPALRNRFLFSVSRARKGGGNVHGNQFAS